MLAIATLILALAVPAAAQTQQDALNYIAASPLFKDAGITGLSAEGGGFSATLGGEKVYLFYGKGAVGTVWNLALRRTGFGMDGVAGPAASALAGFKLSEAVFIAAPDANDAAAADLPASLKTALSDFLGKSGSLSLKPGVAAFAEVDLAASSAGPLAFARSTLGVSGPVRLTGTMDAEAFKKLAGLGGDGPAEFSLSVSAEKLAPPGLAYAGNAKDLSLVFARSGGRGSLSGGFTFAFRFGREEFVVPLRLDVYAPGAGEGETAFKVSGAFPRIPAFLGKIPGLRTDSLAASVEAVVRGSGRELDLSLEARGSLHSHPVDFTVALVRGPDGKLADYEAAFHDTRLPLGDLPGLNRLPGARTLTLDDPVASRGAVGGRLEFRGETLDAVLFDDPAGGWHLAFAVGKSMTLGEIIGKNAGLAKEIVLPRLRFILSTNQVRTTRDKLPLAAQNFFGATGEFRLEEGVNLLADFDPAKFSPELRKPLAFIGVTDLLEVGGAVGGLFGEEPFVELSAAVSGNRPHGFNFLKKSAKTSEAFYVKLQADEVDLGIETEVLLPGGKHAAPMAIDARMGLMASETAIEVFLKGGMKGDWHDAAGIRGFTLENPFLTVGVQESGGFDLGIDGTVLFGGERVRASADLVILPEGDFVPEAVALAGEVNKISLDAVSAHADSFSRAKKGKGLAHGGFKGAKVEFKDVAFAFMTPGAHLPTDLEAELHIVGEGVALRGTLLVDGRELGKVSGYASNEGLSFDGRLDPFELGPLDLRDAELDAEANLSSPPSFLMSGDIELFHGFRERYRVAVMPADFEFLVDTKFGGLLEVALDAKTTHGLSFARNNDFEFDARLSADYEKAFAEVLGAAVDGLKKGDRDIASAQSKVDAAKRKVDGLKEQIADSQAADKRNYDNARRSIDDAERKVDGLRKQIDDANDSISHYKHASKEDWKHVRLKDAAKDDAKISELGVKLGGLESAYGTAKAALEAAKKTARAATEAISPKTRALQASLATAQAGLDAADGVLEGARKADQGLEAAAKAVQQAGAGFELEGIEVSGSLHGLLGEGRDGRAPSLAIRVKIAGRGHTYSVPIDRGARDFKKLVSRTAQTAASDLVKALSGG